MGFVEVMGKTFMIRQDGMSFIEIGMVLLCRTAIAIYMLGFNSYKGFSQLFEYKQRDDANVQSKRLYEYTRIVSENSGERN